MEKRELRRGSWPWKRRQTLKREYEFGMVVVNLSLTSTLLTKFRMVVVTPRSLTSILLTKFNLYKSAVLLVGKICGSSLFHVHPKLMDPIDIDII